MKSFFTWKSNWFGGATELFFNSDCIGRIKSKGIFKAKYECFFRDNVYFFEPKGIFGRSILVLNEENQEIANIEYSMWQSKAIVNFDGRKFYWNSIGFFDPRWELKDNQGVIVRLQGRYSKGEIESETEDEFLVFVACFLQYYYSLLMASV